MSPRTSSPVLQSSGGRPETKTNPLPLAAAFRGMFRAARVSPIFPQPETFLVLDMINSSSDKNFAERLLDTPPPPCVLWKEDRVASGKHLLCAVRARERRPAGDDVAELAFGDLTVPLATRG